jgi:hypothetical protein
MKTKLGALALGLLATTVLAIGAFGSATSAAADPDPAVESADAAIASGDHTRLPYWLRQSIIACAADTIDARVVTVKAALRQGYSLKEIAARHEVRAPELKRGILACERDVLDRLVDAGKLTRLEAARIFDFVEDHIERIINYHYQPNDPALADE